MIKKLRIKIIVIEILAFMMVTGIIIFTINIASRQQMINSAHQVLLMLYENDGVMPDDTVNQIQFSLEGIDKHGYMDTITVETPYNTRYFSVYLNSNNQIVSFNLQHIAAISEDDLDDYILIAMSKQKKEGSIGIYRYLKVKDGDTTKLFFVDCSVRNSFLTYVMHLSLLVGILCMLLVCIFVYLMSGVVIKPMEENFIRQRQFFQDASHELKTPVAAISANVDVLELVSGENEITGKIRKQTKQLSSLINEMLTLSKLSDNAFDSPEPEEFSLSNMINQQVNDISVRAVDFKIQTDIKPDVTIKATNKDVYRLISVLLDNSMKYCKKDGIIDIKLTTEKRNVKFSIFNTCDPIDDKELIHLFDRFYRGDTSRNRDSGSYGIGLSIAKAVVDNHKGKIWAKNEKDGIVFEFTLPFSQ